VKLLTKVAFVFLLAHVNQVSAQQITGRFRPEKEHYLVGEPIFIVFEVVNSTARTVEIAEDNCSSFHQPFKVDSAPTKKQFSLFGCQGGFGGSCAGSWHEVLPGTIYQKRFLLEGPFQLDQPGIYHIRANRDEEIRSKETNEVVVALNVQSEFDVDLRLPQEGELKAAYQPLLNDLQSRDVMVRSLAASAVTQNPPQFTETAILALAEDRVLASASVEGLKNLASPAARAKLLQMSMTSSPENLRQAAIQALGEIGNPDDCQWILDLASQSINYTQIEAYMAAGRICKDQAIPVLYSLIPTADPEPLKGLVFAFGNTSSRRVVSPLISLLQSPDQNIRRDVAGTLATLTHRTSKYGIEDIGSALQAYGEWLDWWAAYDKTAPIYSSDQCIEPQPLR